MMEKGEVKTNTHHVEGIEENFNDIYVHYGSVLKRHVVFFPGDVQNVREEMESHRDHHRWKDFCYENTADILANKFPESFISIVKASKMNLKTFVYYENFFLDYHFHLSSFQQEKVHAWIHLTALLKNVMHKEFKDEQERLSAENLPICLVSFSKGCEVLNQLIMELPVLLQCTNIKDTCFSSVRCCCWLDNGLPGNSGCWVTEENCLKVAASSFKTLESHTTPYQLKDTTRPWVNKEKNTFTKLLNKYNANYFDESYLEDEPQTIETHFQLLKEFQPTCLNST